MSELHCVCLQLEPIELQPIYKARLGAYLRPDVLDWGARYAEPATVKPRTLLAWQMQLRSTSHK